MSGAGVVVLAAGGTGGHMFPAEALAHALLTRGRRVALMTDSRGAGFGDRLPAVALHRISAGRIGGNIVRRLFGLAALAFGTIEAARKLRALAPAAVVGFGGYASVPTMIAAGRQSLPTLIHEQNAVLGRANRLLAPGGVRFDHLRVSWSRPTEIEGLVLRDPQGDEVVVAPRARWSWSLWEILVTRPGSSTLTLYQADLDIERSADGIVDLLESLKPILSDRPVRTLLIQVDEGKLRFRNQGQSVPFLADKANIGLDLNAYPQPITWGMALVRSVAAGEPGTVPTTPT
jgi:hypothetical protein